MTKFIIQAVERDNNKKIIKAVLNSGSVLSIEDIKKINNLGGVFYTKSISGKLSLLALKKE